MKRGRQRFRHLQDRSQPVSSDAAGAEAAPRLVAEPAEFVEIPAYQSRSETVERSSAWRWVPPWLPPVVVGGLVVFVAVYLAETTVRVPERRREERRHARLLEAVRLEVEANVAAAGSLEASLVGIESAVQEGQYTAEFPPLAAGLSSSQWQIAAAGLAGVEGVSVLADGGALYRRQAVLEQRLRDYPAAFARWRSITQGLSVASLSQSRNRTLVARVKAADREFLRELRSLQEAVSAYRQAGDTLLVRLPPAR
jgi:hypothetical protein